MESNWLSVALLSFWHVFAEHLTRGVDTLIGGRYMNYKLIIVLVCVVLMYSCSRKERIESGCFQPFSVLATEYFGTNEPQRWEIVGRNAGDEFLLKNGILGFVVERNFVQNMKPLSEKGLLKFTGRVCKFWPSWAEKYLVAVTKTSN